MVTFTSSIKGWATQATKTFDAIKAIASPKAPDAD
jgi:hypothetical protein